MELIAIAFGVGFGIIVSNLIFKKGLKKMSTELDASVESVKASEAKFIAVVEILLPAFSAATEAVKALSQKIADGQADISTVTAALAGIAADADAEAAKVQAALPAPPAPPAEPAA